jgi:hypothetical protein
MVLCGHTAETAVLEEFEESHDAWMQRECTRLTSLLRSKLRAGYNEHSGRMNESALRTAGDEALNAVSAIAKHLPRKSMARGIEHVRRGSHRRTLEQTWQPLSNLLRARRERLPSC